MLVNALLVLLSVFVLDFIYARYTTAIGNRSRGAAGLYAVGIIGLSGYAAINYVNEPWLLVPAMVGAFFGTVAGIKRDPAT